ncbi:MAG: hypothetical protein E6590_18080 [Clostridiales bacterium]|nr:hypothetical protein [Clostridiales bacterium]
MTHEEFVADWKERYAKGICTEDHLRRLEKIGRLTNEEVNAILNSKEAN